jgi:hypothetical protein
MAVAKAEPSCIVGGVDFTQTLAEDVPGNARMELMDIEDSTYWPWQSPFTSIFIRGLSGCIRHWPQLLSQCYQ